MKCGLIWLSYVHFFLQNHANMTWFSRLPFPSYLHTVRQLQAEKLQRPVNKVANEHGSQNKQVDLHIEKFGCYEAQIEENERPAVTGSWNQDTSGLSCQYSANEPWQPDNHQPSHSSICTAQVVATKCLMLWAFWVRNHSAWVLSWWREFSGRLLMEF